MSRVYVDSFAYDISKNVITMGEVYDDDVISQSIEIILTTNYGERVFLPNFGSVLPTMIFENITVQNGEEVLDAIISDIEQWEDRISIIAEQASIQILNDTNTILLTIPYIINRTGITSSFERKIIL